MTTITDATKSLNPTDLGLKEDWVGNNAAFTCPSCGNVFIVSGPLHRKGRACPECGQSRAFVEGGAKSGGRAWIVTATQSE